MIRLSSVLLLLSVAVSAQEPVSDAPGDAEAASEALAAPAAPAPEPAPYHNREHRDMSLLAQSLPDDQVLWVSDEGGEVLALYVPAISSEPVGAVLLVQDQDLHSLWPSRLDGLRRYLPEHGWATMLVSLPAPDPVPVPARPPEPEPPAAEPAPAADEPGDAAGADAPRPETEEVFDDSAEQLAHVDDMQQDTEPVEPDVPEIPASDRADQRLAQAIDELQDRGQFNLVLLAEGAGAVRAARLTEAMKYDGFRALVLLDARNALPGEAGDVLAMLKESNVPVLDAWASAHHADARDSESRRQTARRAGIGVYQQLPMPAYEPGQQRLYKRVRGFIEKHARGVKVDNAEVIRN